MGQLSDMDVDLSILTDDHVAELLAKEARDYSLKYSSMGLEAGRSARPVSKAKPNTRFLRHIITETKSHNEALLAKEAAESQARLDSLAEANAREQKKHRPDAKDLRRRQLGDITATLQGKSKKGRHEDDSRNKDSSRKQEPAGVSGRRGSTRHDRIRRTDSTQAKDDAGVGRHRDREQHRNREGDRERDRRHRGEERSVEEDGRPHKRQSRRRDDRSRSPDRHDRKRDHRHEHKSRYRDRSSSHEAEGKRHKRSSSHDRHRSSRTETRRHGEDTKRHTSHDRRKPSAKDEEADTSDPLEDIIGPLPSGQAAVRTRGRGRGAGPSAMDSRFAEDYDPKADVQLDSEAEADDDWDQALEALRDRQRWKQQGADRLRAAGFTEQQIKSWEKSDGKGGEKSLEDVQWAKAGEGREWDRGKITGA